MKKFFALLYALAFALPCFGGTSEIHLSLIPPWVARDSIREEARQANGTQVKLFSSGSNREVHPLFKIPNKGSHVELSYYKVVDTKNFGKPPVVRDWDKDFLTPLPDDFTTLNRNLLRVRPSWILDDCWKMTIKKVKMHDGKPEGFMIFETKCRVLE